MPNFDDVFTSKGTPDENFDAGAWAQKKQAERDGVFSLLDTSAQRLSQPAALKSYLDVQSRMMNLSANNALLVSAQCPDATKLATFDDWRKQRATVNSGEKAISILSQGSSYKRDDGTEGHYTDIGKVFDISQTDAPKTAAEVPPPDPRTLLSSLSSHQCAAIELSDNLPDKKVAQYNHENNTIYVRRGVDPANLFRSITIELATAQLCRDGSSPRDNGAAAYAASYMLCGKYGIDNRGYSVEQLAKSFSGMDAKAIRDQIGKARNAAETISFQMEKTIHPQQRSEKDAKPR